MKCSKSVIYCVVRARGTALWILTVSFHQLVFITMWVCIGLLKCCITYKNMLRWWSSGVWRRVCWYKRTDVSKNRGRTSSGISVPVWPSTWRHTPLQSSIHYSDNYSSAGCEIISGYTYFLQKWAVRENILISSDSVVVTQLVHKFFVHVVTILFIVHFYIISH
jgi:hypothetical protein